MTTTTTTERWTIALDQHVLMRGTGEGAETERARLIAAGVRADGLVVREDAEPTTPLGALHVDQARDVWGLLGVLESTLHIAAIELQGAADSGPPGAANARRLSGLAADMRRIAGEVEAGLAGGRALGTRELLDAVRAITSERIKHETEVLLARNGVAR